MGLLKNSLDPVKGAREKRIGSSAAVMEWQVIEMGADDDGDKQLASVYQVGKAAILAFDAF